jgi:hypothetical protein
VKAAGNVLAEVHDVISVTHHLFFLAEKGYHPGEIPAAATGLVTGGRDCAFIHTGVHSGQVKLMIQVRDGQPLRIDWGWDEVVEVTLHASVGDVNVASIMGIGMPPSYPRLTPQGPGDYRIRVHARGRDTDIDGTAFEPFEEYLIQLWPAPSAPEKIYKATDRYGEQLRQSAPNVSVTHPSSAQRAAARKLTSGN